MDVRELPERDRRRQDWRNLAAINAALTSITDASPTNHYLVKVMPGNYNEQVRLATLLI